MLVEKIYLRLQKTQAQLRNTANNKKRDSDLFFQSNMYPFTSKHVGLLMTSIKSDFKLSAGDPDFVITWYTICTNKKYSSRICKAYYNLDPLSTHNGEEPPEFADDLYSLNILIKEIAERMNDKQIKFIVKCIKEYNDIQKQKDKIKARRRLLLKLEAADKNNEEDAGSYKYVCELLKKSADLIEDSKTFDNDIRMTIAAREGGSSSAVRLNGCDELGASDDEEFHSMCLRPTKEIMSRMPNGGSRALRPVIKLDWTNVSDESEQERLENDTDKCVVMLNMPYEATQEDLQNTFKYCGKIESVQIVDYWIRGARASQFETLVYNKDAVKEKLKHKYSPIYAIVRFTSKEAADRASCEINRVVGALCKERLIFPQPARLKTDVIISNVPFSLTPSDVMDVIYEKLGEYNFPLTLELVNYTMFELNEPLMRSNISNENKSEVIHAPEFDEPLILSNEEEIFIEEEDINTVDIGEREEQYTTNYDNEEISSGDLWEEQNQVQTYLFYTPSYSNDSFRGSMGPAFARGFDSKFVQQRQQSGIAVKRREHPAENIEFIYSERRTGREDPAENIKLVYSERSIIKDNYTTVVKPSLQDLSCMEKSSFFPTEPDDVSSNAEEREIRWANNLARNNSGQIVIKTERFDQAMAVIKALDGICTADFAWSVGISNQRVQFVDGKLLEVS
eukprot:GHVL01024052.1.p1 GENE.GHVL01024052.1~~GHVL01024052.1.p1  ORF type:complete len:679 (+),score=106.05 GHVL01024052.1:328-2364(+)